MRGGGPAPPGGSRKTPPFFHASARKCRTTLFRPLPRPALLPRPFSSGFTPRRPKPAEDGAENGMGSARGAAAPKAAPGAEAAPKAIRRQAAETPQNRPQSTPEKDEKMPRPSGTKKDPQYRNPALRVFVGRSGRGAAVNSWLPRSYAVGSDAVRKTDRTYAPGRGHRPGGGARDHAPPGDV